CISEPFPGHHRAEFIAAVAASNGEALRLTLAARRFVLPFRLAPRSHATHPSSNLRPDLRHFGRPRSFLRRKARRVCGREDARRFHRAAHNSHEEGGGPGGVAISGGVARGTGGGGREGRTVAQKGRALPPLGQTAPKTDPLTQKKNFSPPVEIRATPSV